MSDADSACGRGKFTVVENVTVMMLVILMEIGLEDGRIGVDEGCERQVDGGGNEGHSDEGGGDGYSNVRWKMGM